MRNIHQLARHTPGAPSSAHSLLLGAEEKSFAPIEWAVLALALLFHILGAGAVAIMVPFPTRVDELQHFSYIRQMFEAPALFPDY